MTAYRVALVIIAAIVIAAFFHFDLTAYLQLDHLKGKQSELAGHVAATPLRCAAIYFFIYIAVATLSLPGAAILTIGGGAIFGLFWGTILVSLASTIGATFAFLTSRYLFQDMLNQRFRSRLAIINKGIDEDGPLYLFMLRLVPIFPFFVINLAMGLTSLKTLTFLLISQLGMFPATLVFVNAGTQIAKIETTADILSPILIASFIALGLFPFVAKRTITHVNRKRKLQRFVKPDRFDRNLIVIGGGAAGLVCSYLASATNAKVTLVEKHLMGGDCLNTGCVPSKALLRTAKFIQQARNSQRYGIAGTNVQFEFRDVMKRIQGIITRIAPKDSVERYSKLGVECIKAEAKILSPYHVQIGERELTTRNIIIAAGASPFVPPIPGLNEITFLTSDNLWDLRQLPARLLVLGGGPIGCEISQAFARLGSVVTQIEMAPRLLTREDTIVSSTVLSALLRDGVDVKLGYRATEFRNNRIDKTVVCESLDDNPKSKIEIAFDEVVVATGRRANTQGYGLEELGLSLNEDGTIATDCYLATEIPNIYACGDVAGPYQYTHTASHQAWYATLNSLFGRLKRFAVDYRHIPWCTFTDPEVARVGLNEADARNQDIAYELTTFDLAELDRALTDEVAVGVVRVLTVPGKDKILGVTIVSEHAGDLITEFVLAMKHSLGLRKILNTIHIYPTLAEANKFIAGAWRRKHTPLWLLKLATLYNRRRIN